MTTKKWIEVNELGELYKEIDLVCFDVPLLFVCKDVTDKRYLILCIDEEEGQYLCLQISNQILLKMLNNHITMAETFKQPGTRDNFLISYNFSEHKFEGKYIDVKNVKSDMLPDEGAYFQLCNKKINEYIKILSNEVNSLYQAIVIKRNLDSYTQKYPTKKTYIIMGETGIEDNRNKFVSKTSCRGFVFNSTKRVVKHSFANDSNGGLYQKGICYGDYNTQRGGIEKCLVNA